MRIIFFGTSEFGIPALNALKKAGYEVVAVVTQPDKPAGRKQELKPSVVKQWALVNKIPILQPAKLDPHSFLPLLRGRLRGGPDLFIVASYGKIIPTEILNLPRYGTLNIHPSLLPKYRGPSPIQTAILHGDAETGVTIMQLDAELDHGPIISSQKTVVRRQGFRELHDRLAKLGAELLTNVLPDYFSGKLTPIPQDHSKATFTKIIIKEDARIDWRRSADEIDRMIRAYEAWPVAWTMLDRRRVKIHEAVLWSETGRGRPGEIIRTDTDIQVCCGQGILRIKTVQQEGNKKMSAADFARGHRNLQGRMFG